MKSKIIKVIIFLAAILLIAAFFTSGNQSEVVEEVKEDQIKKVSIKRVGDIEKESENFVSYGKVVSSSKVEVSPETSGLISRVNYPLGSFVSRNQVVVELKNTTERQAVLQATASLNQSEANLAKVKSSQPETLANLETEVSRTEKNLDDAERQLDITLSSLNTDLLSVLENTINIFFSDEESVSREFIPVSNSSRGEQEVERDYADISQGIYAYAAASNKLEISADLIPEVTDYLQRIIKLVDTVTESQSTTASTISSWKSNLSSAKATLEAKQAQIISQNNSVFGAEKALEVARNNFNEQSESGQSIDTTIAEAGVQSAKANLALAQINLEKTLVRSPISGILSDIDVRVGQLAGPSSPVFTIESDNVLRVDTSLSSEDIKKVKIGDKVIIDKKHDGTISNISPSIGQDGKIEVRILIDGDVNLVSGLGVSVTFGNSAVLSEDQTTEFIIPIEAVFVRNNNTYVYVVESGAAVVREIETDSLFGDKIVVKSGLTSSDELITYARGVKDGEKVAIESAASVK